jgi:hypothetical protein
MLTLTLTNVCLEGKNGHDAGVTPVPLMTHFGHQRPHTDLAPIGFAPYIWSAAPAEGLAPASGRNLLLIRHEQPMRMDQS